MKKNTVLAALTLGVSMFAVTTHATTVSFSFTDPLSVTDIHQTGNLGLFDSNLGTLNSVIFTFTGSGSTLITLTNNASGPQNVRAIGTVDLFASSTNLAINAALFSSNPVVSLANSTGFVTLAAGATEAFGPLTDTGTFAPPILSLTTFQQAGGGLFDVSGTSLSGISITGGGGNIASQQTTTAGIAASIVYDYTPTPPPTTRNVPEPTTLALLGLGLTGLSLRKRKQA